MHLKVTNQRKDFLHQLSRRLVNEYSLIAVEDLQVPTMIHDHHFAKSFNDAGLSILTQMLDYKVSETCSRCGYVRKGDEKLSLSERVYSCPSCGLSMDRDVNAAKNILTRAGLVRSHACGDDVRLQEEAVVVEAGTRHSANG